MLQHLHLLHAEHHMPADYGVSAVELVSRLHKVSKLAILVCVVTLADLFRATVGCPVEPAVGIHSHFMPFVFADVHSLSDVFEDGQQSLNPHRRPCPHCARKLSRSTCHVRIRRTMSDIVLPVHTTLAYSVHTRTHKHNQVSLRQCAVTGTAVVRTSWRRTHSLLWSHEAVMHVVFYARLQSRPARAVLESILKLGFSPAQGCVFKRES